jgi:hypothetical protein
MSSFPSIERRIVQTSFPIAGITCIVTEIGRNNNGGVFWYGGGVARTGVATAPVPQYTPPESQ